MHRFGPDASEVDRRLTVISCCRAVGKGRSRPAVALFSPFVLRLNDSESQHADPSRTSLAISDRLARNQSDRPFPARGWPLRALQAPARSPHRATGRREWGMVGCRRAALAGRARSSSSPLAYVRLARRYPNDAPTGLSRDGTSQSRSELQRPALAKSRRALSTLPHDPRRSRTSPASVVECVSTPRARRSVHRALQLDQEGVLRRWIADRYGGPVPAGCHRGPLLLEARLPVLLRVQSSGEPEHDRSPSISEDLADATTPSRR